MKQKQSEQKIIVDVEDKELNDGHIYNETPNIYKLSRFQRIPFWVKAVLVKYWSFGMIYYFIVAGLGLYLINFDPIFSFLIMGVTMGLVNDIIINNILSVMDDDREQSHWYWIFHSKKAYSLFINIFYGILWGVLSGILAAFLSSIIPNNTIGLFQEPLSFALVGSLVEAVFISIKNILVFRKKHI